MLIKRIIPNNILNTIKCNWLKYNEQNAIHVFNNTINRNNIKKCYIGRGFFPVNTPSFLIRHVLNNPKWYTAYTPYQSEISQGRLESLFNFQSMICNLTQMDTSNASLLDESTAVCEAMYMLFSYNKGKKSIFVIDKYMHPQNYYVLSERAKHLNIKIIYLQDKDMLNKIQSNEICGLIIQNPDTIGNLLNKDDDKYEIISKFKKIEIPIIEISFIYTKDLCLYS